MRWGRTWVFQGKPLSRSHYQCRSRCPHQRHEPVQGPVLGSLLSRSGSGPGVQFTAKLPPTFKPVYPPGRPVGPPRGPWFVSGEEGAPAESVPVETVKFRRPSRFDQSPEREAEIRLQLQKFFSKQRETGRPTILRLQTGGIPAI